MVSCCSAGVGGGGGYGDLYDQPAVRLGIQRRRMCCLLCLFLFHYGTPIAVCLCVQLVCASYDVLFVWSSLAMAVTIGTIVSLNRDVT